MKTDLLWWQKAWVSALTEGVCCSWRHSLKSNASENRRTLFPTSAKRCNFSFNKNHEDPGVGIRLPHGLAVGRWASIAIAMKKLRICEWAACASWQCVPCTQPSSILRMLLMNMKLAWAWLAGMGKSCCWSLHNTQQRDRREGVCVYIYIQIADSNEHVFHSSLPLRHLRGHLFYLDKMNIATVRSKAGEETQGSGTITGAPWPR